MPDQLALARPGHQHVADVTADDGAGRPAEQRGGRDRPRDHPSPGIEHEGGEARQVRFAPARQPGLAGPGCLWLHRFYAPIFMTRSPGLPRLARAVTAFTLRYRANTKCIAWYWEPVLKKRYPGAPLAGGARARREAGEGRWPGSRAGCRRGLTRSGRTSPGSTTTGWAAAITSWSTRM